MSIALNFWSSSVDFLHVFAETKENIKELFIQKPNFVFVLLEEIDLSLKKCFVSTKNPLNNAKIFFATI